MIAPSPMISGHRCHAAHVLAWGCGKDLSGPELARTPHPPRGQAGSHLTYIPPRIFPSFCRAVSPAPRRARGDTPARYRAKLVLGKSAYPLIGSPTGA